MRFNDRGDVYKNIEHKEVIGLLLLQCGFCGNGYISHA